jgi:hypothetical protein
MCVFEKGFDLLILTSTCLVYLFTLYIYIYIYFFKFNVGVWTSLRAPRLIPRALKLTTM